MGIYVVLMYIYIYSIISIVTNFEKHIPQPLIEKLRKEYSVSIRTSTQLIQMKMLHAYTFIYIYTHTHPNKTLHIPATL